MDKELDAVIAALRSLSSDIRNGNVLPHALGDPIGDILTGGGSHQGLNADQIDQLAEDLNFGIVKLVRSNDAD